MARHRPERILGGVAFLVLPLALLLRIPGPSAGAPSELLAALPAGTLPEVAGNPRPAVILFDSIQVSYPQFSPNADGVKDAVDVAFVLRASAEVTIAVTPALLESPRRELVSADTLFANLRQRVTWDGRIDNLVVADGEYWLRFTGTTLTGHTPVANMRSLWVDTSAPVPQITSIEPPIYTPGVQNASNVLRVRVHVSGANLGDSLQVSLRTAKPLALRLVDAFLGDGDYQAKCDSCATPRTRVPDGIHDIQVRASDPAGNEAEVTGQVDKDIVGPSMRVTYPSTASEIHVQAADSLRGTAWDRHGVRQVQLEIMSPADTLVQLLSGSTAGGDTLRFTTDLASPLAAEGRYQLHFFGTDTHGVADTLDRVMVVDRTSPPQPRLSPRPGPVYKLQQLNVSVVVDSAGTYKLVRSGGATDPESLTVRSGRMTVAVLLDPGANHLKFEGIDRAGNVSPPETLTVRWETSIGPSFPEHFKSGNEIQVSAGSVPGRGCEVHLYATDGTLVQRFESHESKYVYTFEWDLTNPSGRRVRNGAYLMQVLLYTGGGSTERWRKLIAVLE